HVYTYLIQLYSNELYLHSFPTRRSSDLLSPTFHPDQGIDRFARLALEHNPEIRITVQASWVPFDGLIYRNFHPGKAGRDGLTGRSEEHTSELQSRFDLVCRLLLEKKKNK